MNKSIAMFLSISELLPSIAALSHADKFRLVQFILAQLAEENDFDSPHNPEESDTFDPEQFCGVINESKQTIDEYLLEVREGWN